MSYTTHVNFRADDITAEEYETAISELETVDGVEVEERKKRQQRKQCKLEARPKQRAVSETNTTQ